MRKLLPVLLSLPILLAACSEPVQPASVALAGEWATEPEVLHPSGSMQRRFYFSTDGHFSARTISFGLYPGQVPTEISAVETTSGRFHVEADRLFLQPDSLVTDDRYRDAARPVVQKPYPYDTFYEDARFVLRDGRLALTYIIYPADAPVPTKQTFLRVGLD